MKNIIIKGKSEKNAFEVSVGQEELLGFLSMVIEKSAEEYDAELATSPGGLPTAIFTCIVPAKARAEVGWDLTEGWDTEKAMAAFESRLERKTGAGVSIEARQKAWDEKASVLKTAGIVPETIIGKRPVAKTAPASTGKDKVNAILES